VASVIPDGWAVPAKFRQRIGSSAGRQRAMIDSGHLLLVLHEIPGHDEAERRGRLFWRSPEGEWRATGTPGKGLPALKAHLEKFREVIHDLDEKVDDAKNAADLYHVLRAMTPIARTARNTARALQEARAGIDDRELITLRDLAGDLERSAELTVTDAQNALEYLETKAAEEQTVLAKKGADAQHRLNLIAALFFPVTALGSILGTNMHTGLEGHPPWVFWTVFVAAFATGFFVRGSVSK
jgi:hypothetical protein